MPCQMINKLKNGETSQQIIRHHNLRDTNANEYNTARRNKTRIIRNTWHLVSHHKIDINTELYVQR